MQIILISALLSSSCANSEDDKLRYAADTTLLENGAPIYVEDSHLEDYISREYFTWRNEGNPDPEGWENAVVYENGTDFLFELTSDVYSLGEGVEAWGVTVYFISDELLVGPWCDRLNLEKYEDGTWVRQGILDVGRIYGTSAYDAIRRAKNPTSAVPDIAFSLSNDAWQEGLLLLSPLTVRVSEVFPEPTPGQYRFIFYVSVENGGKSEPRQYYIPFEVVE